MIGYSFAGVPGFPHFAHNARVAWCITHAGADYQDLFVERFKPEALYGNPARRQVFLVVDLATEAAVAELMYILTWATGTEPTFTPISAPGTRPKYDSAE